MNADPLAPDDFLAHFHQGAYEAGYDQALDDARRWGWRRPQHPAFLLALVAGALLAGLVIGYSVKAATPRSAQVIPSAAGSRETAPGRFGAPQPVSDVQKWPSGRALVTEETRATAQPTAAPLSGLATWYCGSRCTAGYGPSDLVAAAGTELQRPGWRGGYVQVCADECVIVQLVDVCTCAGRRIIDLSSAAFSRLAPLSRGVIEVTVGGLRPPETDVR